MGNNFQTFKGRSALIIGATGGIGFSVAQALYKRGAALTLHGRSDKKLREAAARIAPDADIATLQAEFDGSDMPPALLEAARRQDILVIAYGPFVYKPLAATTHDDWLLSALHCLALPGELAAQAAQAMAARGFGRIVLFGGTRTDAVRGFKNNAAYAAAKTGLGVIAKSIASEFSDKGVTCSLVCPGFVDTEYIDAAMKAQLRSAAPGGKLILPEEIAELTAYIISSDVTNGAVIVADKGLYAL